MPPTSEPHHTPLAQPPHFSWHCVLPVPNISRPAHVFVLALLGFLVGANVLYVLFMTLGAGRVRPALAQRHIGLAKSLLDCLSRSLSHTHIMLGFFFHVGSLHETGSFMEQQQLYMKQQSQHAPCLLTWLIAQKTAIQFPLLHRLF